MFEITASGWGTWVWSVSKSPTTPRVQPGPANPACAPHHEPAIQGTRNIVSNVLGWLDAKWEHCIQPVRGLWNDVLSAMHGLLDGRLMFPRVGVVGLVGPPGEGLDHINHFWHHPLTSPTIIVWEVVGQLEGKFGVTGAWLASSRV
jgi:hypothetical protein